MVCDGFEGRFDAWVSHERGERAACCGEPVGVECLVLAGLNVEEVRAADGERAGWGGEFDHFLWRVGGVRYGDAGGVAVFVGDHVAFFQVAEFRSFPGAARFVGDVLAVVVCRHESCPFVVSARGSCARSFCLLWANSRAFARVLWGSPSPASCAYGESGKPSWCGGVSRSVRVCPPMPFLVFSPRGAAGCVLLGGGEELRHVVCRNRVHVAGLTDVALGVVEGAVGDAFFGVCAVPGFTEVLCAAVDVTERGFDGAHVRVCRLVVCADSTVPFVVYEAGAVAFDTDGDSHLVVVADIGGKVGLLLVGERVPCVCERLHDGEVCGAGCEAGGGFGDLVDCGSVGGHVLFSSLALVVGACAAFFSLLCGFSVSHVWARLLALQCLAFVAVCVN